MRMSARSPFPCPHQGLFSHCPNSSAECWTSRCLTRSRTNSPTSSTTTPLRRVQNTFTTSAKRDRSVIVACFRRARPADGRLSGNNGSASVQRRRLSPRQNCSTNACLTRRWMLHAGNRPWVQRSPCPGQALRQIWLLRGCRCSQGLAQDRCSLGYQERWPDRASSRRCRRTGPPCPSIDFMRWRTRLVRTTTSSPS
jgi:hypothetical protein